MNWLELIAALLSVANVWLSVRRRISSFPVGLVASLAYAVVFVRARLYSDALLQGIFAIAIVYGWVHWSGNMGQDQRVRIAPLRPRLAAIHLVAGALIAIGLGYTMQRWTDAALPWLDASLTAASLVGSWWEDRRHIACWWLWIVVDTIYVGEYVYKRLDTTSVLYAGFVILAIIGLRSWQRAARSELPAT